MEGCTRGVDLEVVMRMPPDLGRAASSQPARAYGRRAYGRIRTTRVHIPTWVVPPRHIRLGASGRGADGRI